MRRVLTFRETDRTLDVTIVIPVRDEAGNVAPLAREVTDAMTRTGWAWECIWVDDCSSDPTVGELMIQSRKDPHHRFIQLHEHFGQTVALVTGFASARGRVIATLDGDGQNDPADLPGLVELVLAQHADMANGYRTCRQDTWVRKVSSRIANGFRNWLTNDHVRDVGCSVRAFRSECVESLFLFDGMHRFLPTLVRVAGYDRIVEIPVRHRPRRHDRSKYGIHNRLWVGILDTFAVSWMVRRGLTHRGFVGRTEPGVVEASVSDARKGGA